ncbi:restriction endonuclease subunit S [Alcanivorax sp.]|uniref:restriction endonuclease subunit S n=1 Tax=Alcanivorax sp. TaxID=1872427 RepID=UPI0025C519CD|nr:restriction endonuclease subunit S [Alcanivorax sp.]
MIKEQLPDSWKVTPLSEIAAINPTIDKRNIEDETLVSFVPMPAVEAESGRIDISICRHFKEVKKGYTGFLERDVIFAKITPCMENGKVAVIPKLKNDLGFGSTEFHVIRAPVGVSPELLYYYVSSKWFRVEAEHNMTGAVGQRRVPTSFLEATHFPLPPTNEQKRIVAKIEELLSELDNGIAALKTAREQLNVYRQAVLKHAFEGKLTAKWREENAAKLESPEQLLARIQQERETCYQQQLEDWKAAVKAWEANGKEGKKPGKPRALGQTENPTKEELELFPERPNTWQWVKLGQLTWSVKDGPHYSPKYCDSGIPFITGGNVRPSGIDFENVKYISEDLHEELSKRCKPAIGDILYTKGGTTGIARVNTYDIEFNVWVHVAVLKVTESVNPFYLQHALNSPDCYVQSQKYTHGVGNQDLGLTRMVNIILPICSLEEQKAIVNKVDVINSELDSVEDCISKELKRAKTLRQSILKKAFSGQLVPQDPSDEPASELLERIQAEKAAEKAAQKASVKPKAAAKSGTKRGRKPKVAS